MYWYVEEFQWFETEPVNLHNKYIDKIEIQLTTNQEMLEVASFHDILKYLDDTDLNDAI